MTPCLRHATASGLLLFGLAICGALSGCGGGPPAPAERYYRLTDAPAQSVPAQQWTAGSIEIQALRTDGPYVERAIVYSNDALPTHVETYNYHSWIYPPAYLIQQHMIGWFRTARLAPAITDDDDGPEPRYVVSGRIVRFEEALGSGASRAEVTLELEIGRSGQRSPLLRKIYTASQPAASDSMDAFVLAMGQALEQIYAAFSRDLMAVKAEQ